MSFCWIVSASLGDDNLIKVDPTQRAGAADRICERLSVLLWLWFEPFYFCGARIFRRPARVNGTLRKSCVSSYFTLRFAQTTTRRGKAPVFFRDWAFPRAIPRFSDRRGVLKRHFSFAQYFFQFSRRVLSLVPYVERTFPFNVADSRSNLRDFLCEIKFGTFYVIRIFNVNSFWLNL